MYKVGTVITLVKLKVWQLMQPNMCTKVDLLPLKKLKLWQRKIQLTTSLET